METHVEEWQSHKKAFEDFKDCMNIQIGDTMDKCVADKVSIYKNFVTRARFRLIFKQSRRKAVTEKEKATTIIVINIMASMARVVAMVATG